MAGRAEVPVPRGAQERESLLSEQGRASGPQTDHRDAGTATLHHYPLADPEVADGKLLTVLASAFGTSDFCGANGRETCATPSTHFP